MAKVLVIEDNTILNQAYKMTLKMKGHVVATVFDGEAGLEAVKKFKPEIILLDMLMPKMNGVAFLKAYDPANKHKDVRIVLLTNLDQEADVQEALRLGAHKYLLKAHAGPSDLLKMIDTLLGKAADK